MRRRTLAKSFASWPEELMLGIFLLLALWCHYTLMRRAAALVRYYTLGCLLNGRRPMNGVSVGGRLRVVPRDDRMQCGVLSSCDMPVRALVQGV
jgi:hypothetical protein